MVGFELLYWHWLVFGMALAALEMILASFTILWFGLGAIVVGALLWLLPGLSLNWQLAIWAVSSIGFSLFWFFYFKPRMRDKTMAGLSREAVVGQVGMVIQETVGEQRGIVRFTMPLLGADEWPFICSDEVKSGDRVRVIDVSGNSLVVEKH